MSGDTTVTYDKFEQLTKNINDRRLAAIDEAARDPANSGWVSTVWSNIQLRMAEGWDMVKMAWGFIWIFFSGPLRALNMMMPNIHLSVIENVIMFAVGALQLAMLTLLMLNAYLIYVNKKT